MEEAWVGCRVEVWVADQAMGGECLQDKAEDLAAAVVR